MPRAHRRDLLADVARLDAHAVLPVIPDAIGDCQRDGAAQRHAAAHAADDLGVVALHLLALAAPVPQLAPPQVRVDGLRGQRQPRGYALHDDGQLRAVRLAGGQEAEHAALILST